VQEEFVGKGANQGVHIHNYYDRAGVLRGQGILDPSGESNVFEFDGGGNLVNWTRYDEAGNCVMGLKGCDDPAQACEEGQPGCAQPGDPHPNDPDPDDPDPANPGTPPDDFERLPCAPNLADDLRGSEPIMVLDPHILPSPEGVEAGISNACLETVNSSPHTTCEPSVALCMDPWFVNDRCECVPGGDAPEVDQTSPNCFFVDCGDGATCDPSTGMCQTSGTSGFEFPGGVPPPPFR
jgi:hypothetical protein